VGAIVGGDVVSGGLVTAGSVLTGAGALEAGAAGTVVGATLDVLAVVEVVVVVDVDVGTVSGVEASGLANWSSRAHALARTINMAAAAHDFRTAAVFHAVVSRVIATPLVEPRPDRQHGAPHGEHDADIFQSLRGDRHEHEADQRRTQQEHRASVHPASRFTAAHENTAKIQ